MIKVPEWMSKFSAKMHFHKFPLWFVYNPHLHRVKGHEIRQVLDILEPADILFRTWKGYLDTAFIPGYWSHAGMYIGENKIIHAQGTGIIKEDILDFCRADGIAVKRIINLYPSLEYFMIKEAERLVGTEYDYDFTLDNNKYYCSEFIDHCCQGYFKKCYEVIGGRKIITPEGLYSSNLLTDIIEFRY